MMTIGKGHPPPRMTVKALEDVVAETSFGYIGLHGTGWYNGGHLLGFEHG